MKVAVEGLKLTDPNGAVLQIMRVEDLAFAISLELATDEPFRMYEDDRAKLRAFLRPLDA